MLLERQIRLKASSSGHTNSNPYKRCGSDQKRNPLSQSRQLPSLPSIVPLYKSTSQPLKLIMKMSPQKRGFPADFFSPPKELSETSGLKKLWGRTNMLKSRVPEEPYKGTLKELPWPNLSSKKSIVKICSPLKKHEKMQKDDNKENQVFQLTFSMGKLKEQLNAEEGEQCVKGRPSLRKQSARHIKYMLV